MELFFFTIKQHYLITFELCNQQNRMVKDLSNRSCDTRMLVWFMIL